MKIQTNSQTVDIRQIKSVNTYAKIIGRTPTLVYKHLREKKVNGVKIDGKQFVVI